MHGGRSAVERVLCGPDSRGHARPPITGRGFYGGRGYGRGYGYGLGGLGLGVGLGLAAGGLYGGYGGYGYPGYGYGYAPVGYGYGYGGGCYTVPQVRYTPYGYRRVLVQRCD